MRVFGLLLPVMFGLLLAVVALKSQPPTEAESILAVDRAHDAGDAFAKAWNDWARQHDRFKTSIEDRKRYKRVRKLFLEFDRQYRDLER